MRFFGRQEEISALQRQLELCEKRVCARMVVVTGRRRVGKTTLILKALENRNATFVYCFVPRIASERNLAGLIAASLTEQLVVKFPPTLTTLAEAVAYLLELSKARPMVLVIDEYQNLEGIAPNFWPQLQKVWDMGKDGAKLLFVMSGSLPSRLERIFGIRTEPLYGHSDVLMTLQPFSTEMMRDVFALEGGDAGPGDFLLLYALTGGVARYVEYFVDNEAITGKAMLQLVFSTEGG